MLFNYLIKLHVIFKMSQQINGVVGGDGLKDTDGKVTSFELEINKIPLSTVGDMCSTADMASAGDTGSRKHDSDAEIPIKLEVREDGNHESEVSANSDDLERKENEPAVENQGSGKYCVDDDASRDLVSAKDTDASLGHDISSSNVVERFTDGNFDRECSGDSERGNLYENPSSGLVAPGRRRYMGRAKGRKSAGRANLSLEHYQSEDANSPSGIDFRGTDVGSPFIIESGRGVVIERRKRGRPRGSRASGRGANSFEGRVLDDVYSGASDSGDTEATGSNFSDSGLGGGVISPHPVSITKAVHGALRPGCKSYRGRAASMGRGFRVSYGGDTASTWEVDTGVVPMEYESALSPSSEAEVSGKRRLSLPDDWKPAPRAKRGRGARGRSRGRPRGRRPRISFDHDSAVENDSSDIGTPGFDTPVLGAGDAEFPDPSLRTESVIETPVSSGKPRRGRGRGSRGGRGSLVAQSTIKVHEDRIVTCAVCKDSMTQTLFSYHKLRVHNSCTWREGIDPPLDLTDDRIIKSLLKQTLQKRKQLTCEKCGISRSSLVGYESHITFCAKSEGERDALMETCPVCARRMMPSSLKVHMGVHRQEDKSKTMQSDLDDSSFDPGEGSSTSTGKIKRAAANRAVSLMQSFIKGEDLEMEEVNKKSTVPLELKDMYEEIMEIKTEADDGDASGKKEKGLNPSLYQVAAWARTVLRHGKANCKNPGCSFSSTLKDELIQHYKTCELRPKINYLCKMCNFGCEEEVVMKKHVSSAHMGEKEGEEAVENMSEESESEELGEGSDLDSDDIDGDEVNELEGELADIKQVKKKREKKPKEECKLKKEKPKEEDGKTSKATKYTKNVEFIAKHGLYNCSGLQAYMATLRWTLEFQLSNHSILPLYTEWKTFAKDWIRIGEKDVDAYLPKARTSPQFARIGVSNDMFQPELNRKSSLPSFNRLPLFGTSVEEAGVNPCRGPGRTSNRTSQPGFITMFAGGPVWAQAWCPTPLFINCHSIKKGGDCSSKKSSSASLSQFLAVSCNPDFDSYHNLGSRVKGEKFIIQIWDCGPLGNVETADLVSPIMALGIAHEFGPVWALEWCPSGCLDMETNSSNVHEPEMSESKTQPPLSDKDVKPLRRLGLLAAACGDGTIRIFSVPFPSELAKDDPLRKPSKRDFVSSLIVDKNCETQPTQEQSGGEEVNPCNRTEVNESVDDDSEMVCVEVEERIGKNKSVTSSKGKPSTIEIPHQSAFSRSGMTQSEIQNSKNSRYKERTPGMNSSLPIFKPSSVITLVVNSCSNNEESETWQCLCLSWSLLGKSHSVLAAGFSNGLIALWDLTTSSTLLRVEKIHKDGSTSVFLRPYHMFFAHKNAVTGLALACCAPEERIQTGEKYPRYLISGSRDRLLKIWDLQDTAAPLASYPRGMITGVTWLTNWMSFISSVDDSFACGRANSKAQALRQYGYKPSPMLNQNSPVMSVVCSDWLNTIAHGTNAGEACILSAQQVLLAVESSKVIKNRRTFVYYTELIDLMEGMEGKETESKTSESQTDKANAITSEGVLQKEGHEKKSKNDATGNDQKSKSQKSKKEKVKVGKKKGKKTKANTSKKDGASDMDSEAEEESNETDLAADGDFKESPRTYAEATEKYGILFCDVDVDVEAGRLPKDAMWILQQTERMRTIPVDLYPISAINRMCWNPNMQSFIWLASAHQSGLVRLCRVQKTRNRLVQLFEANAHKKIRQVFMQRTDCSS